MKQTYAAHNKSELETQIIITVELVDGELSVYCEDNRPLEQIEFDRFGRVSKEKTENSVWNLEWYSIGDCEGDRWVYCEPRRINDILTWLSWDKVPGFFKWQIFHRENDERFVSEWTKFCLEHTGVPNVFNLWCKEKSKR